MYAMEYIRNTSNTIMTYAATQMHLRSMLHERNQPPKLYKLKIKRMERKIFAMLVSKMKTKLNISTSNKFYFKPNTQKWHLYTEKINSWMTERHIGQENDW